MNNDGLHATAERAGSLNLTAGPHAIKVTFFERTGGEVLQVKWQGPGIPKALIPSSALKNTEEASIECAEVKEGHTASLICPAPGQTIKNIRFASYGTPTGACENYTLGTCNAAVSKSKIEASCLNKSECSIPATNSFFGDPCRGTYKRLYVEFECR